MIIHVDVTEVNYVSEAKGALDSMQPLPVLELKGTHMGGNSFSVLVQKGAGGKLYLTTSLAAGGKGIFVHDFINLCGESKPLPRPQSVVLLY